MQVAGAGKIADVGEIRSLADFQSTDGFRNEPVEVGVALAVRMGRQIDRHVVDVGGHVGAMIEIVAAQVILVGLAAVGVVDHRQAGSRFENLARSRDRAGVEVGAGKDHLARQLRHHRSAACNIGRSGLVRRRRRGCRRRAWRCHLRRLGPRHARLGMWGGHLDGRERGAAALCGRERIGRGRRRLRCRRRLRPGAYAERRDEKHHRRKPTRCHRRPTRRTPHDSAVARRFPSKPDSMQNEAPV